MRTVRGSSAPRTRTEAIMMMAAANAATARVQSPRQRLQPRRNLMERSPKWTTQGIGDRPRRGRGGEDLLAGRFLHFNMKDLGSSKPVVLANSYAASTVGVAHFPSIPADRRAIGIARLRGCRLPIFGDNALYKTDC